MPLSVLKQLLQQHRGNAQIEQNLLTMYARLGGTKFDTVEQALAA